MVALKSFYFIKGIIVSRATTKQKRPLNVVNQR
jgi:hypothetical protein